MMHAPLEKRAHTGWVVPGLWQHARNTAVICVSIVQWKLFPSPVWMCPSTVQMSMSFKFNMVNSLSVYYHQLLGLVDWSECVTYMYSDCVILTFIYFNCALTKWMTELQLLWWCYWMVKNHFRYTNISQYYM